MKKRIVDNWKTTLIGLLIAGGVFALVFTDRITWLEASGFLITSGLLAWVKDSILKVAPDEDVRKL